MVSARENAVATTTHATTAHRAKLSHSRACLLRGWPRERENAARRARRTIHVHAQGALPRLLGDYNPRLLRRLRHARQVLIHCHVGIGEPTGPNAFCELLAAALLRQLGKGVGPARFLCREICGAARLSACPPRGILQLKGRSQFHLRVIDGRQGGWPASATGVGKIPAFAPL